MKYKKKEKKKNLRIFFLIHFISIIFLVSFFLNLVLIFIMFLGFFTFNNFNRKNYIEKKLSDKDIDKYLLKYNINNNTNLTKENLKIKKNKNEFPTIIFFSFHAAHESILDESQIKITDRMIQYYKEYDNIYIYAINYYSNLYFPTEKGIKKNSVSIVQKIIDEKFDEKTFYHIGFDCWSLGTCIGLYTINQLKLKRYINIKFIDLRTPPLNLFNIAYQTVNFFIYSTYPIIFIFQYEDFFNNKTQIQNLITKYPYIDIHFYIPENDNIVDIKEQNKLFNVVNYKYIRNIEQFKKGKTHSDDYIVYGLQQNF